MSADRERDLFLATTTEPRARLRKRDARHVGKPTKRRTNKWGVRGRGGSKVVSTLVVKNQLQMKNEEGMQLFFTRF